MRQITLHFVDKNSNLTHGGRWQVIIGKRWRRPM